MRIFKDITLRYNTHYDRLYLVLGYYIIKGFTNEAARLKGYGGLDKGEPFQIKGFTKGENAEFFGKIKGFSPVNHFGFTLICQARCTLHALIVLPPVRSNSHVIFRDSP